MKIFAFFAFVATVSAISYTTIYPSTNSNCGPPALPPIWQCGHTPLLNYDIVAAKIHHESQNASWYKDQNCDGEGVPADPRNDICVPLPFIPRCVRIVC